MTTHTKAHTLLTALLIAIITFPAALRAQLVPREYRAVWLTTIQNLDWPKTLATTPERREVQKAELVSMLDELQACGINTVLFQTRLRGTVAYPSAIEPWDVAFTGKAGRDPGYDPLSFAVDECHKRGMELHAWIVTFPVCKAATVRALGGQTLPRRHPELCQQSGDGYLMDPGVPGTGDYIASLCREIVERYDVDGIHLDYVRYPEKGIAFNDARTYRRYGQGQNLHEWRRRNVTDVVRKIHRAVKDVRPWIKLSCAPVGKFADLSRYSSRGWNARDAVYQDAIAWQREGLMDVLFPMMYFDGDHFYPFLADWAEQCGTGVVPGLGIYFLDPREGKWLLPAVKRQMNVNRSLGTGGYAMFRARFLTDNHRGLYDWTRYFNRRSTLPPALTTVPALPPSQPQVKARIEGFRLHLTWHSSTHTDPTAPDGLPIYYNVYRTSPGEPVLLSTQQTETSFILTPALPSLLHACYGVTAIDAYGRESTITEVEAL